MNVLLAVDLAALAISSRDVEAGAGKGDVVSCREGRGQDSLQSTQ